MYHGSRYIVNVLEPHLARGIKGNKDRLCVVYASHMRNFAIPFALPIKQDQDQKRYWYMYFKRGEPRILIKTGWFDVSKLGYLYKVPIDSFVQIDDFQWISYDPVKPFDFDIIHSKNFIRWIEWDVK